MIDIAPSNVKQGEQTDKHTSSTQVKSSVKTPQKTGVPKPGQPQITVRSSNL